MTLAYDVLSQNQLFTRVAALAECLCAQIQDPMNAVPDVCFCGLVPGEAAAAIYADGDCNTQCGMAWTRVISVYPMTSIGVPSSELGNCGKDLGVDVELGILRCMSMDEAPTPGELLNATQLQIADALVMQRAVLCCPEINPRDVILGAYTPMGPEGGLVGGQYTLSMGVL